MTELVLPGTPTRFDHVLTVGKFYRFDGVVKVGGVALDLSGVLSLGAAVYDADGTVVLEPTAEILVAASGTFAWSSPAVETAEVPAGEYRFALWMDFGDGDVDILQGLVQAKQSWEL